MSQENPLIVKFRQELLRRGASGIKNFGLYFQNMDKNDDYTVNLSEFTNGVHAYNLKLTNLEINEIFKLFDKDGI